MVNESSAKSWARISVVMVERAAKLSLVQKCANKNKHWPTFCVTGLTDRKLNQPYAHLRKPQTNKLFTLLKETIVEPNTYQSKNRQ